MHSRMLRNPVRGPRVYSSCRKSPKSGFTLIEVLTVIAIIGVLVGLLLPAIGAVRRRMSEAAMVFEIQNIEQSINAYKNKYGDFPPDGSSLSVMTRHLRKAFPSIAASEIALFNANFPGTSNRLFTYSNGSPEGVMDPPEALVFFLGGFSDNPAFPISGEGGPLFISNASGVRIESDNFSAATAVQYNPTRNNPIHDFGNGSLTVEIVDTANGSFTLSNDEALLFNSPGGNDVVPTYSFARSIGPVCYFESRTYAFNTGSVRFFNQYTPAGGGIARPYKSADINTTIPFTANPANLLQLQNNDRHFRYVNEDSFQLIAAGLDESYGGLAQGSNDDAPIFYSFPSGEQLNILLAGGGNGFSRYTEERGQPSSQLDNITNFAESNLESAIDQ